jgi:hypothetical protein
VKSHEQERWVMEAADYARAVALNSETYRYKRATKGGWVWESK